MKKLFTCLLFATATLTPSAMANDREKCGLEFYKKNYAQAFPVCEKVAREGFDGAQYAVGVMYLDGKGTDQNFQEAYIWFSLAAQQGLATAVKAKATTAPLLSPDQLQAAEEEIQNRKPQ